MSGVDENTRLLRIIVRLLCLQVTSGESPRSDRERSQREKIKLLASAGMTVGDIAELLGTTNNTVSVSLSTMKREKLTKKVKSKTTGKQKALPAPPAGDEGQQTD